MLFVKAIIFGAGFYVGWSALKAIDYILYRKYGRKVNKAIQKIIKIKIEKKVKRTIGFESKWEES